MDFMVDRDLQAVVEFMQSTLPTNKLLSVSEALPQMARLLWSNNPQEPCIGAILSASPITNGLLPDATVCAPAPLCVGGGSEVGENTPLQM
jgi:hypothetical protein